MRVRRVIGVGVVSGALLLGAGCSSDKKDDGADATTTTVTTASDGGSTTTGAPTTAASGSSGGERLDNCAQTTPDSVPSTFLSSIQYAGPETYMQCVWKDSVSEADAAALKPKGFDADFNPTVDATAGTYAFKSKDGASTATITVTKEANGKYYVTKLEVS